MPNHCDNDLLVSGKKPLLEEFKNFAASEECLLDANRFIPYPEEFREQDRLAKEDGSFANGYNNGGYEWCIANWGTKWGIYEARVLYEKKASMKYGFLSAWAPPLPVIRKMSELFPELTFTLRYYESGAGYQGVYKIKRGNALIDQDGPYRGGRGG